MRLQNHCSHPTRIVAIFKMLSWVELAKKPGLCFSGVCGEPSRGPLGHWSHHWSCEGALGMIMGSVLSSLKALMTSLTDINCKIDLLSGMGIAGGQWFLFQDCYFTMHTHHSHIHTNKSPAALVQFQCAPQT